MERIQYLTPPARCPHRSQFFISGLESDTVIQNRVLEALFERICNAHQTRRPFKVYVTIPLLPGFEGHVAESPAIRRVLYYQFRTISRGNDSLYANLLQVGIDPDEYICFFGLRTWQATGVTKADRRLGRARLVTEIVYVHSKLLIVDDEACLIGSGNINERSLMGNRDTEFAVVVRPPRKLATAATHGAHKPGFTKALRQRIFREHWGTSQELDAAIIEPWTSEAFNKLRHVAANNTATFEKHFQFVPRNSVRTLAELRASSLERWASVPYSEAVEAELKTIHGHVCILPLLFLANWAELLPNFVEDSSGSIVGNEVFV